MTGKAGRSGNRTERRGSRYIQRLHIGKDAAQSLKIITLARGLPYTPETAAQIAANLIDAEWRKMDTEIMQEAEWEGQIV